MPHDVSHHLDEIELSLKALSDGSFSEVHQQGVELNIQSLIQQAGSSTDLAETARSLAARIREYRAQYDPLSVREDPADEAANEVRLREVRNTYNRLREMIERALS